MKKRSEVLKILNKNLYMTISTVSNEGLPWVTPVFFAQNKELDLYWYSHKSSEHSSNINNNELIAITVFDSTKEGDDIKAVYMKAISKELKSKEEIINGLKIYSEKLLKRNILKNRRQANDFSKLYFDFKGRSPLRMYRATPYEISILAPSKIYNGHYVDRRELLSNPN